MTGTIEVRRLLRASGFPAPCAVFLDGERIGEVLHDVVLRETVQAGEHKVQAKFGLYLSPSFVVSVGEGETVKVEFSLPKLHEWGRLFFGSLTGKLFSWEVIS